MEEYLDPEKLTVALDDLWPDPNNPRLALEEAPGYADVSKLFNGSTRQRIFEELGETAYNVDDLVAALAARDRTACGQVAPPHGLYLVRVEY